MNRLIGILILLGLIISAPCQARNIIDLSGEWQFREDPQDVGKTEKWYLPEAEFDKKINVPGAWNPQGVGEPAESLFYKFAGPGWYRKRVSVPKSWLDKEMYICIDGAYRTADVWINGDHQGTTNGYLTPIRHEIAYLIIKEWAIDIVIRVDGRRNPEADLLSGSMDISKLPGAEWGGILGNVWLETTEKSWIENAYVIPRRNSDVVEVIVDTGSRIIYGGSAEQQPDFVLQADIYDQAGKHVGSNVSYKILPSLFPDFIMVQIEDIKRWSPDSPYVYTLDVRLYKEDEELDYYTTTFGVREFATDGDKFTLNGKPIFLRGFIDDCVFPNTLAPPVDKSVYLERFKTARQYGFNFARCRSWAPPKDYLDAADETGIMLQIELPSNPVQPPKSMPAEQLAQYYIDQWQTMIKPRRSHPSIIAWGMFDTKPNANISATELYEEARKIDASRLLIDWNDNPPLKTGEKPRVTADYLPVKFDKPGDYDLGAPKLSKPVIVSGLGEYGTIPNLDQRSLFSRAVRPYWLINRQAIAAHQGLSDQLDKWVDNSNKLQAAVLKSDIEAARLSNDIRGYNICSLQDNWSHTNGVLDIFFRSKAISADEFKQFNAQTVLLMESKRRSYRAGETAQVSFSVSRYEDAASNNAKLTWKLLDGDKTLASGEKTDLTISSNGLQKLLQIDLKLPSDGPARKLTLTAELIDSNGKCSNSWDFWVFPSERADLPNTVCLSGLIGLTETYPKAKFIDSQAISSSCTLFVTSELTKSVINYLDGGGKVLLVGPTKSLPLIKSDYLPSPGGSEKEGNAGTLIDIQHPAMESMPGQDWCEPYYRSLLTASYACVLSSLPQSVKPIIRCLDSSTDMKSKAYLFEARVGKGKLLVGAMNFQDALEEADPAGCYFLDCLIKYALGPSFEPAAELDKQYFENLIAEP